MTCYRPLTAFQLKHVKTDNGKSTIVFKRELAGKHLYEEIQLPCGRCIGCRIDRSKDWALRCVHEASRFDNNCFITLTFNDSNLDCLGSLQKRDFQLFMKRLRKKYNGIQEVYDNDGVVSYPIRYFHCGEYGDNFGRPHHHACIFNFDFVDKVLWQMRDGVRLYRSAELELLWPYGFSCIGDVTYDSAAYVARYITKKINGKKAILHYSRVDTETGEVFSIQPEYITMSRRPGIGRNFFNEYRQDVYPKDFITFEGKKFKPPAYYDKLYDTIDPETMEVLKRERKEKAKKSKHNSLERLRVREKVMESKMKFKKRRFENANNDVFNL